MADETLLDHVAHIVSAHVSNNAVAAAELAGLIQSVHATLAELGQAPAPVDEKPVPAVSVRSSLRPDAVTCLDCGAKLKMLKRHLGADHGMTPAEYRTRWNLPVDYPMVAPNYAAQRKQLAVRIGLGRKSGQVAKSRAGAGQTKPPPAKPPSAKPQAAKGQFADGQPAKTAKPRRKAGVVVGG